MEHRPQAIRSADISVGFTDAEFLISFLLPFARTKADEAARAPGGHFVAPPFFAT